MESSNLLNFIFLIDFLDLVRRRNRSPSSSTENLAETTPILSLPNRLVPINRKYIDTSTNLLLNTPIKEFLPDQYIYDAASRLGQVGWNFFKVAMAALISVISLILKLSIVAIGYAVSAVKDKAAAGKIKLQETTNSFQASVTRLYSNEDLRADAISDSKFESSIATAVTTTANSNSNDFSSFSSIKAAGHGNGRQSETGDWKNHNSENIADIKYDFDYHEDELESIEKHEEMQEKSELNFSRPQRTSGIIYTPTNGSGSNSSSSTSSTSMSCYNHQKLEKRNHGTDFDSDTAISPDQPEQTLNLLSSPNERLISSISGNNNSLSRVQLKKPIDSGSSSKPAEHPSQLPFEDRTPPRSASKVHSNVIMSSTTSNSIISASSRTVDEAWGEKPTLGNNPAEPAPTFTGSIITVTMIKNSNPPKKRGILRRSFQGAAWFVPILGWRVNRVIDDVLEGIEKPDGLAHLHVVNV